MPFDPASLKYDAAGLIPCVAQDHASGEVLMVAWMNAASVAATLETGKVDLLVAVAGGVLGEGRDFGAPPAAGGAAGRLRPGLPAGAGGAGGAGLSYGAAVVLLYGGPGRGGGRDHRA
jgi:hypothetical protein